LFILPLFPAIFSPFFKPAQASMATVTSNDAIFKELLEGMNALRKENAQLATAVEVINGRVNMLAGIKQLKDEATNEAVDADDKAKEAESEKTVEAVSQQYDEAPAQLDAAPRRTSVSKTSKIILTSYPGQSGVDPLPMEWGHKNPAIRGPVVVSRHPNTIRRRNGLFASLSLWYSLIDLSYRCTWRFL
jgi:hypothetical protein